MRQTRAALGQGLSSADAASATPGELGEVPIGGDELTAMLDAAARRTRRVG
jgi:hypothetical protein